MPTWCSKLKSSFNAQISRIIIIIIIINEEIIVAFSPRTTRTRYRVKKNKTARYVVSSSIEKQLVTDTTAQTTVS